MSKNQWVWGFSIGAEKWNGRLAMLAFTIILVYELLTSVSVLYILDLVE